MFPGGLVRAQHHKIDVGMRIQFSPSIAADRNDGQSGAHRRTGPYEVFDDAVDQCRASLHDLAAACTEKMKLTDTGLFFGKELPDLLKGGGDA